MVLLCFVSHRSLTTLDVSCVTAITPDGRVRIFFAMQGLLRRRDVVSLFVAHAILLSHFLFFEGNLARNAFLRGSQSTGTGGGWALYLT